VREGLSVVVVVLFERDEGEEEEGCIFSSRLNELLSHIHEEIRI
jgi:hypothetical protein